MKSVIPYIMEDGQSVLVEVDDTQAVGFGLQPAGAAGAEAAQTLESALSALQPAINRIKQMLHDMNNPDEIGLEFGVKILAGVGAVFASTSTEANFTVKLTWKP